MSLKAVVWAQDHAPVDTSTDAAVLVALARSADDQGRGAWPSVKTIMRRTKLSESSVRRGLRSMEKSGVIRRGDQSLVAHLRADERPVVWDLDMPNGSRGAAGAPRGNDRGVSEGHPEVDRGVSQGPAGGVSLTGAGCHTDTQEEQGEDLETLSPEALLVRRAAVVAHGDERELIEWIKSKNPNIRGQGWWITCESRGDLTRMAKDWQAEKDTTSPKPRQRPDWCGACDEPTRFYERDDGRWAKCPQCHPNMIGGGVPSQDAAGGGVQPPPPATSINLHGR